MKNFKRLGAVFLALAMVVSLVVPFVGKTSAAGIAANDEKTNTVTLHKLLMEESDFKAWDGMLGEDKYDGSQDIKTLETKVNKTLREIKDVYFALKFADDYSKAEFRGKYVKALTNDKLSPKTPLEATNDVYEAVGGLTKDNGITFETADLSGNFVIDEIHEKSTYVNGDKILTDTKAVPVNITLPLVNSKGVVKDAHVYPKNTENKPTIGKKINKDADINDIFNDDNDGINTPKGVAVGTKVPYLVSTTIPAKSKLAKSIWSDEMTKGLTYNNDLEVKLGDVTLKKGDTEDYTCIIENDQKFTVTLTTKGLEKINNKETEQTITLKYTATVNEKAIARIPEKNDVTFTYGNNPGTDGNPDPLKPNGPKVVTGGAKFVKIDKDTKARLKDAKFVIKDKDGKYLKKADLTGGARDNYNQAQTKFEEAVKKYNEAANGSKDKVDLGDGNNEVDLNIAKENIGELEKARDEAWSASLSNATEWIEKDQTGNDFSDAFQLTSNESGQFEISGLAPGEYKLEEIKAPADYALPTNNELEFTISDNGNQATGDIAFGVGEEKNAISFANMKVSIPQTGGIGTIIFAVAGIALMGFAAYSMKKNSREE